MRNHNSATYYSLTGHAPAARRHPPPRHPGALPRLRLHGRAAPAPWTTRRSPASRRSPTCFATAASRRASTPASWARRIDPFFIGQDPNRPDFRLPELSLPPGCRASRLDDRRGLQKLIDAQTDLMSWSETAQGIDAFYTRALTMLASPRVKEAFDLSQEPDKVRDDYGRTTYGQSCLLARRLIEAGVRFVSVYYSPVDRRQGQRRLGHARRQLQPAQGPAPADHRPDRADPVRDLAAPRPARRDAGRLDGRVRPHAAR